MATSGKAYAISVAIYVAILIVTFILFSIWRRLSFTRKFFAPKRYIVEDGYKHPPSLPSSLLGWVGAVIKTTETQVISSAGIDAALYIKYLRMGIETFLVVTILAMAVILPVNVTNDTVDNLMNAQNAPPSSTSVNAYTYWIPPPPSPPPPSPPTPAHPCPAAPPWSAACGWAWGRAPCC